MWTVIESQERGHQQRKNHSLSMYTFTLPFLPSSNEDMEFFTPVPPKLIDAREAGLPN